MGRLNDEPDPIFWALNSSIRFDRRLAQHDVAGSIAHARGLARIGVLDPAESDAIVAGLGTIRDELTAGRFGFESSDEDIHMAIERRLFALIGAPAGKLHTARSRNDQVATDLALYVGERSRRAGELCHALMARILAVAEAHRDWPIPGYTHLQRAQPVYLAHHLLAWFWMLERDVGRFAAAADSSAVMPLGSGALAGLNWEVDRDGVAAELGFASPTPNSIDAVSNRDFALDYMYAAAACATHLSRLGAEIVLWSSSEFGFCDPAEDFSSTSSIMPQKKNPDAAELLRAKAPRVVAALSTLLGVSHALPLAYSKDLQEDKEALFDAVDTVELCLAAADGLLAGIRFNRDALVAAAADQFPAATDIADLLVRRGMAFRAAHGIVGSLVRVALEAGVGLGELSAEQLAGLTDLPFDDYRALFEPGAWIDSKLSVGGTAAPRLAEQFELARRRLAEIEVVPRSPAAPS